MDSQEKADRRRLQKGIDRLLDSPAARKREDIVESTGLLKNRLSILEKLLERDGDIESKEAKKWVREIKEIYDDVKSNHGKTKEFDTFYEEYVKGMTKFNNMLEHVNRSKRAPVLNLMDKSPAFKKYEMDRQRKKWLDDRGGKIYNTNEVLQIIRDSPMADNTSPLVARDLATEDADAQDAADREELQDIEDRLELKAIEDKQKAEAQGQADKGPVLDEAHPEISGLHRFIVQNFATPEAGINYLKENYPGLDIKLGEGIHEGKTLIRLNKETNYKVLDPSDMEMADVSDVASTVGLGGMQTGAQIMGGLMGGLPGAMAAGGLSGGAAEALRQKIGQHLGVRNNMNTKEIRDSALFGTFMPGILGTGATKNMVLSYRKKLLEHGRKEILDKLSKATTQAEVDAIERQAKALFKSHGEFLLNPMKDQTGLARRAFDKMGWSKNLLSSKIGELLTGVPDDAMRTITDRPDDVKAVRAMGPDIYAEKLLRELEEKVIQQQSKVGEEIGNYVRNSGHEIDITKAKGIFLDEIDKIEAKWAATGRKDKNDIYLHKNLKKAYRDIFVDRNANTAPITVPGNPPTIINPPKNLGKPDLVDVAESFNLKDKMRDGAGFFADGTTKERASADKYIEKLYRKSYDEVANAVSDVLVNAPDMNAKYRGLLDRRDFVQTRLKNYVKEATPDSNDLFANVFDRKGYKVLTLQDPEGDAEIFKKLKLLDKELGTNVEDGIRLLRADKFMSKPGLAPVSSGGTTSTSRSLTGGVISSLLGGPGGFVSQAAMTSPLVWKYGMKAKNFVETAPYERVAPSIWNLMRKEDDRSNYVEESGR